MNEIRPGVKLRSVKSKTGRIWRVGHPYRLNGKHWIHPEGDDVVSARSEKTGRWQGGPRSMVVPTYQLQDPKRWEVVS